MEGPPAWAVDIRTLVQAFSLTCDPKLVPSLDHFSHLQKHSLTSILVGSFLTLNPKIPGGTGPE